MRFVGYPGPRFLYHLSPGLVCIAVGAIMLSSGADWIVLGVVALGTGLGLIASLAPVTDADKERQEQAESDYWKRYWELQDKRFGKKRCRSSPHQSDGTDHAE